MRQHFLAPALLATLLLAACGNRGGLFLPPQPTAPVAAQAKPADAAAQPATPGATPAKDS